MVLSIQEEGTPLRVNKSFPQAQILFPARSGQRWQFVRAARAWPCRKGPSLSGAFPPRSSLKSTLHSFKKPCLVSFGERGPCWAWIWEQNQVPVCPGTISQREGVCGHQGCDV